MIDSFCNKIGSIGKLIGVTLLIVITFSSKFHAQVYLQVVDSLKQVLANTEDEISAAILESEICARLNYSNPTEARERCKKAVAVLERKAHPYLGDALFNLATCEQSLGNAEDYLKNIKKATGLKDNSTDVTANLYATWGTYYFGTDSMDHYYEKYFRYTWDNELFAHYPNSYAQMGLVYAIKGDLESADSLWEIGISHCTRGEFDANQSSMLYNLSVSGLQSAKYDRVIKNATHGLDLADKNKDITNQIGFLNILGKVSLFNRDTSQATSYWIEAAQIIDDENLNQPPTGDIIHELALYHLHGQRPEEAKKYADKLLKMGLASKDKADQARASMILALMAKDGGFKDQALSLVNSAMKDTAHIATPQVHMNLLVNAADVLDHFDQKSHALKLISEIESYLDKNYMLKIHKYALELKYKILRDLNKPHKALIALEKYKHVSDEFKDKTNSDRLHENKVRFDTERKELKLKNKEIELQLTKVENGRRQNLFLFGILGLIALFTIIFLIRSWRFSRSKSKMQSQFTHDLIKSQEMERRSLARELHDGVGQSLILLKNQLAADNEKARFVGQTLEEIRSVSRGLHPFVLEKLGLTAAIEYLVNESDERSDVFFDTEIDPVDDIIPKEKHVHIYRIIQEAITNLIKYAETPSAQIAASSDSPITFKVIDFGKGFDFINSIQSNQSLGMKTMMERAAIINAELTFSKNHPSGTIVELICRDDE